MSKGNRNLKTFFQKDPEYVWDESVRGDGRRREAGQAGHQGHRRAGQGYGPGTSSTPMSCAWMWTRYIKDSNKLELELEKLENKCSKVSIVERNYFTL